MAGIKYDRFIRTTEPGHRRTVQDFWAKLDSRGFLHNSEYSGYYSIADESFIPEKDLVKGSNGFTTISGQPVDLVTEQNVVFRPGESAVEDLRQMIREGRLSLQAAQVNEIEEYIRQGLDQFSISRPISRVSWGIPAPGRDDQIIYVWFDALLNYLTVGNELDHRSLSMTHVIGKDITKFHCYLYPLMLLSSRLFPKKMSVVTHQHFLKDSFKMSKSLGNVIDPLPLIEKYGHNALRYYLLSQGPQYRDASIDPLSIGKVYYNTIADLFVNLVMRVSNRKLHEVNDFKMGFSAYDNEKIAFNGAFKLLESSFRNMDFIAVAHKAHKALMELNRIVHESEFWLSKSDGNKAALVAFVFESLRIIALFLYPLVPDFVEEFYGVIGFGPGDLRLEEAKYGKRRDDGSLFLFDHGRAKGLFIRKVI